MPDFIQSILGKLYNVQSDPTNVDYPKFSAPVVDANTLPNHVDMRNHLSPVEDQGQTESCTGHAIAGACEYLENKALGFQNFDPNFVALSRLFVYYNERNMEGSVATDGGAVIADGISSIQDKGICEEQIWPFDLTKVEVAPPDPAYEDASKRKVTKASKLDGPSEQDIKQVLASGYPIVVGVAIYQSFETSDVASTGQVPMPDLSNEGLLGGHAILIVGYNDENKWWIFRNSWGQGWGDAGYGYLPYEYLTATFIPQPLASDFWVIEEQVWSNTAPTMTVDGN